MRTKSGGTEKGSSINLASHWPHSHVLIKLLEREQMTSHPLRLIERGHLLRDYYETCATDGEQDEVCATDLHL